jgi:hypothetical protein
MGKLLLSSTAYALLSVAPAWSGEHGGHAPQGPVADAVISEQRAALARNTAGQGFGPQAPRDIDAKDGSNAVGFGPAPPIPR